ncbi:MAG: DUF4136 domain-containing protein [Pseudomonadota bacterium]
MIYLKYYVLALFIVMLSACSTIEVSSEYDESIRFSDLKSYRWMPKKSKGQAEFSARYKFLDSRIRAAVDEELKGKGYERQAAGAPDFFIRYSVWVETKTSDDKLGHWAGWAPRIGPVDEGFQSNPDAWRTSRENDFEQGTLLLLISDGKTRRVIWRGTAQARVLPSEAKEKKEKKINEAVKKILARFPPK